jgi:multiple sugar transport system substrate-binding protein
MWRRLPAQYPQVDSFISDGELIGMPSDASLLVTDVNTKDFSKAGITKMPTTFSQYQADLKAGPDQGRRRPSPGHPVRRRRGLSTYWYEMTAAFGGQVLSSSYKPEFTRPSSPGYKAMDLDGGMPTRTAWCPRGTSALEDYQGFSDDQAENLTASVFSDYSGDIGTVYDVPSSSKVVGEIEYIPTPGVSGPAPNLANPDGIGIPVTAKHVSAAVEFIKWYDESANQAAFAGADGPSVPSTASPCRPTTPGWPCSSRPARSPAPPSSPTWRSTTPGLSSRPGAALVPRVQQRCLHQPAQRRRRPGERGQCHQRHRLSGVEPWQS